MALLVWSGRHRLDEGRAQRPRVANLKPAGHPAGVANEPAAAASEDMCCVRQGSEEGGEVLIEGDRAQVDDLLLLGTADRANGDVLEHKLVSGCGRAHTPFPRDADCYSRKSRSFLERLGWRSFLRALASIWRMRSRVTPKSRPTSSKVRCRPSSRPNRRESTRASRSLNV